MEWVAVVVVVLVLAALAWWLVARRRRAALRQRFGPEYERRVERAADRGDAEQSLREAARRRDELQVRELSSDERARYAAQWRQVQAMFVDRPGDAAGAADLLVARVMAARGYPVEDFEARAEMAAVDHPDVVEHYRVAHAIHERIGAGTPGARATEDLRSAFVHYRALFAVLLGGDDTAAARGRDDRASHTGAAPADG